MAIRRLSKNWSTALWSILEPRALLSAVTGGLRLVLNKLGGVVNFSGTAAPVGLGEGYRHITVKMSDIFRVSGEMAGTGTTNVTAGLGTSEYVFRVDGLPHGILLFAKSATTANNTLTRGVDFIETATGCYRFKTDPSLVGVCSYGRGVGYCSWLCTIGIAVATTNQDRLNNYKGSCNYRVNSKFSDMVTATECSNGISSDALLVCCGTDIVKYPSDSIVSVWCEGNDKYCRTTTGEVVKLPTIEYKDTEFCSKLSDLPLSRIQLYAVDNKYYNLISNNTELVNWPNNIKPFEELTGISLDTVKQSPATVRSLLNMSGFDTVDTTKLSDPSVARLTLPFISKVSTVIAAQQLQIELSNMSNVDELILYYTSDSETSIYDIVGASREHCVAFADAGHGAWLLGSGEIMKQGNLTWCSLNGSTIGLRPKCGYRILGATVIRRGSTDDTNGDILEHVNIANEFIHPGGCIIITAAFK